MRMFLLIYPGWVSNIQINSAVAETRSDGPRLSGQAGGKAGEAGDAEGSIGDAAQRSQSFDTAGQSQDGGFARTLHIFAEDGMRIIRSRAPVRVCDMGGWTDTWFCKRGAVLSLAVDLYTHVRLVGNDTGDIHIFSEDLDQSTEIKDFRKIEYDGNLDLLKAAVKRTGLETGADIFVRADSPPGCGTGTSASVAVATLGALALFSGKHLLPYQVAELAHALETEELGMESGVQDQYAAAFGGIAFMEIDYPRVRFSQLRLNDAVLCELEERMILVYIGTRRSSDMHLRVVEQSRRGDKQIHRAFDELTSAAREMVDALTTGDIDSAAALMNRNWGAQKQLHPEMTSAAVDELEKVAFENGAAGFKLNGAGGGGSAAILASPGREQELRTTLSNGGYTLLPCKLNFKGLQAWEYEK